MYAFRTAIPPPLGSERNRPTAGPELRIEGGRVSSAIRRRLVRRSTTTARQVLARPPGPSNPRSCREMRTLRAASVARSCRPTTFHRVPSTQADRWARRRPAPAVGTADLRRPGDEQRSAGFLLLRRLLDRLRLRSGPNPRLRSYETGCLARLPAPTSETENSVDNLLRLGSARDVIANTEQQVSNRDRGSTSCSHPCAHLDLLGVST